MTTRTSGELKRLAREFLTGNYTTPVLASILATAIPGILLSAFPFHPAEGISIEFVCYLTATAIISVLASLLGVGLTRLHLHLARKQEISVLELFWVFRNKPDRYILGILFLYLLAFSPLVFFVIFYLSARTAVFLSSFLFFICVSVAGLLLVIYEFWLLLSYSLIFPIYLDQPNLSVLDGFRNSRKLMYGNKIRMMMLIMSFLGWGLLGILSMGIGFLWIQPYLTQASVNLYLDIKGELDIPKEHIDTTV